MISIPNPCGEDFDKMTPTERGAYCKKCDTDTFDFRHLSNDEVFQILDDNKGKHICGRFNKSQLNDLNHNYMNWKNQSTRTFQSKFMLACVIVFGMTLFSCNTQDNNNVLGELRVEQITEDVETKMAFINEHLDEADIDLLDYINEDIDQEPLMPFDCKLEMAGEISGNMVDYNDVVPGQVEYTETVLGGVISTNYRYVDLEPQIIEVDSAETTLPDEITIDPDLFEAKAFPNPTQGFSTLAIDIEKEGQFDIVMYNMNGQQIRNIHSGILLEGRQTFDLDLSEMNSGMYLIQVISGDQAETIKIQKVN